MANAPLYGSWRPCQVRTRDRTAPACFSRFHAAVLMDVYRWCATADLIKIVQPEDVDQGRL